MMVKITFAGDIMCKKEHLDSIQKAYDALTFKEIFQDMSHLFNSSDYLVGNLETPIAGEDLLYSNKRWSFNSPLEFALAVRDAGFDLVTTANNHCLDRGVKGLYRTMDQLEEIKMKYTGTRKSTEEFPWIVEEIDGIRVGFLSFTYGTNADYNGHYLSNNQSHLINLFQNQEPPPIKNYQIASRIMRKVRSKVFSLRHPLKVRQMYRAIDECRRVGGADIVVMYLHIGGQRNDMPEPFTIWMSDKLVKSGVDAVVGCHEHVVHPIKLHNDGKVEAYSLGNFLHYPGSELEYVSKETIERLRADYSILLHLYLDDSNGKARINRTTFSITKNIIGKSGVGRVVPVIDLHRDLDVEDRASLEEDVRYLVNKVTGGNLDEVELKSEYILNGAVN